MANNPLYEAYRANTPIGNLDRLQQFMKNFNGDPRAQVQQLLNSGRVTQEQYNRAVQMANQLRGMIKF